MTPAYRLRSLLPLAAACTLAAAPLQLHAADAAAATPRIEVSFAATAHAHSHSSRLGRFRTRESAWQKEAESRAHPYLAIDVDVTAGLFHEAEDHAETEADPLV